MQDDAVFTTTNAVSATFLHVQRARTFLLIPRLPPSHLSLFVSLVKAATSTGLEISFH